MISRLWMLPLAIAVTVLPRERTRRDVPLPSPHPAISYELRNGRWFDGRTFSTRTMWVTEERFRVSRPARVDSVIDLAGRFIVPPFADAHTHALGDGSDHEALVRTWMRRGIFYVRNTNSTPLRSATAQPFVNQPRGIDVIYSYGGLTASGGHPVQIYRSIVGGGNWPGWTEAQLEGQAFHTIDSRADLEAKWPRIVAAKPAFLKVYLEHSEEFAKRRDDPAFFGKRGLDPALLPDVVRRAHAAGLTVSAHVTTAADFRAALAAGIDELSHLPLERITADDAASAARRKIRVVTTVISHRPTDGVADAPALHRDNLALLRRAGVPLAAGTDGEGTVLDEAGQLCRLGVFDNASLLRLLSIETPKSIFPSRRIGAFGDGDEASFVALDTDPLVDFAAVRRASMGMKQGHLIDGPTPADTGASDPLRCERYAPSVPAHGPAPRAAPPTRRR